MLAPGPSNQGPNILSKIPGQIMMGQQGGPMMGIPPGGMPVRMPQVHPFPAAQTPHPGAVGTGPTGPPGGFFPQGNGAQGPDPRLLQERQLQQRMQMVQKLQQQQQFMMGQQPMPHQGQQSSVMSQQAGAMGGQPSQPLMSNTLMGQQQTNLQPGLISNQQQNLMQVPQGMMGNQTVGQAQPNLISQSMTPSQNMMAGQQGIAGNQSLQQLQRPEGLMSQQPGGPHILRGPQPQLTPQQQSILAQRMLLSQQQQNTAKNLAQLQQQQGPQQRQPTQVGPTEPQRALGTSLNNIPGSVENLQQGVPGLCQDVQNPVSKDGGILSPKTPPQQGGGPSAQIQMQQQGPSGDLQAVGGQQQPSIAYMPQQQASQQQSGQTPGSVQQHGYVNNQQAGIQPQVQQMQLTLQRQNSLSTEQVKQESQQMCYVAQQQQQMGQSVGQEMQGMIGQQANQTQSIMPGNPNQQQDLMSQQQKQAMMEQINRGQQVMMTPRPGAPPGQIRAPINIQAIIAQNPQLRHLTPNQQIQQIQAMIAQRQAQQQGHMLRLQGQTQAQMRPQGPQGQLVGPRLQGVEAQQQHPYTFAGKQGPVGSPQQQGVMGQSSLMVPQYQETGSLQQHQTPQGASPQFVSNTHQQQQMIQQQHQMIRGQMPLTRPAMGPVRVPHGHMARPMSPRQLMNQGSPGSPLSTQQRQIMAMRQTPPGQQQSHGVTALSPFQASPSHVGSPTAPTVQEAGSSPASFNKRDSGTPSLPSHMSPGKSGPGKGSPFSSFGTSAGSPLRSPVAKTPHDLSSLKSEPQVSGAEAPTIVIPRNGPSPKSVQNLTQPSTSVPVSEASHLTSVSSDESLCRITLQNIKQEPREVQCDAGGGGETPSAPIKREITGETVINSNASGFVNPVSGNPPGDTTSQTHRTETGQQLLQKLLRTKNLQLASQRPSDGIHNEINGHINSKLAMLEQKLQGTPRNMEVN